MKKLMSNGEKLSFLIKKFGLDLSSEYIETAKSVNKAFKGALYAEYVVDTWIERAKQLNKEVIKLWK